MSRRNEKLMLPLGAAGVLALGLLVQVEDVRAETVCPARVDQPSNTVEKRRDFSKMSPMAKAMFLADKAYGEGQIDAAEARLIKLSKTPRDRNDTAHRAIVRLARIRLQQGRFDEAREFALKATHASEIKVRRQAKKVLADITYREGILAARARYDAADAILRAAQPDPSVDALVRTGQLDQSEAAFKPLLDQPCPIPDDYIDRVKLKLASINLKKDKLDVAADWLKQVKRTDPDITRSAEQAEATLAQKRIDDAAEAAFLVARTKAQANDFNGALAADQEALAAFANASPRVIAGGRLQLADYTSRFGKFDEGRDIARAVSIDPADADLQDRRTKVLARIDEREMDARGAKLFEGADADVAAYRYDKGLATFDSVITSTYYNPEWQQRAHLRKASVLRREFDFGGAEREIKTVAAAPATPSLAEGAANAAADLAHSAPDQEFRGAVEGGLQYDDNAPVIVAAIPGEDGTTPYPANQAFSDAASVVSLDGSFRHRLGSSYNYFVASAGFDIVDQWKLDAIDRTKLTAASGILLHLPSQKARLETGVLYERNNRGGDYLNQKVGLYVYYTRLLGAWRSTSRYEIAGIDDRRPGRDGLHQAISTEILPISGDYGLRGGIELAREQTSRRDLRQTSVQVSGQYGWAIKTFSNWQVDGVVSAAFRPVHYDSTFTASPGVTRHRTSLRSRFAVGPTFVYKLNTEIKATYQYLNIDANDVGYDRKDNQLYLSILRHF